MNTTASITAISLGILETFIFFAFGAFAAHKKYIKNEDISNWTNFVVKFLHPVYIFKVITMNIKPDQLLSLWSLPLIGVGLIVAGMLIGYISVPGLIKADHDTKKTFVHLCAMNNYGFLPTLLIARMWGEEAVAMLFVLNIGSHISYWTLGVLTLGEKSPKIMLKNLFNPNVIAIFLSLIFVAMNLPAHTPTFAFSVLDKIGCGAVPLILILIGATLYYSNVRQSVYNMAYLTIFRVIIIPVLTILALKMLPLPENIYRISVIVALMPTSSVSAVITRVYGGNSIMSAKAVLVTTLASAITIPLGVLIFL